MHISSMLNFESSDKELVEGFHWAKDQALAYVSLTDPVGPWYEAALPGRGAFCMRDVAHQTNGAHVLGLQHCNYNMLHKFASYIHESRDWCSYWEITKDNRPAPVDYTDDTDFWYNLPANFDILEACLRQYHWTANEDYLSNDTFEYFYNKSVTDYISRWDLNNDDIMEHLPQYGRRGLASYSEGNFNIVTAGDLIAAQYAAYKAYGEMQQIKGNAVKADRYYKKAIQLKSHFDKQWWNEEQNNFYGAKLSDGRHYNISNAFLLYFNLVKENKQAYILDNLYNNQAINVEEMSYYPETFYKYGWKDEAYQILKTLMSPNLQRREYPEVSFSVIGALATGLMGIKTDASQRRIITKPGLTAKTLWCQINHVPVFEGYIDLKHEVGHQSTLTNRGIENLTWQFIPDKKVNYVSINSKVVNLKGSSIKVNVNVGDTIRIEY